MFENNPYSFVGDLESLVANRVHPSIDRHGYGWDAYYQVSLQKPRSDDPQKFTSCHQPITIFPSEDMIGSDISVIAKSIANLGISEAMLTNTNVRVVFNKVRLNDENHLEQCAESIIDITADGFGKIKDEVKTKQALCKEGVKLAFAAQEFETRFAKAFEKPLVV